MPTQPSVSKFCGIPNSFVPLIVNLSSWTDSIMSNFITMHSISDINECDSQPCQHGGVCQNYVNRFHCLCKAGYAGVWCERDIDECASQPCLNGGTCSDWLDKYQCSCVLGYDGDICQVGELYSCC